MKKLFQYLTVFAIAALTLTGCDDVPMPFNQPSITPNEPGDEVTPKGSGTADDPYNVAGALQVVSALASGAETDADIYVKGTVKQIRELDTDNYGNATYWITDDGNNQIYIYRSKYLNNAKFTAADQLNVGDTVVVVGKFTNYQGNTPESVANQSYIYSINGKTSGDTPAPTPSGEPSGDGTQANPYNVAAVLQLYANNSYDPNKDVYVKGKIHKVSISTQYGNANYYISDDGGTDNDFEIYRGYYLNGDKFTSEDQLKVGDVVVVCGKLTLYNNTTREMAQGSKIISINDNTGGDTPSGQVGLNETFASGQGGFTITDIKMPDDATYIWKYDDSQHYMKASAYIKRKNTDAQSRLVSPAFSLAGLSKATLTFEHTGKFFSSVMSNDIKVQASTDGTNWTDLTLTGYPTGQDWTFVTGTADLSAYAGQKTVYIGFLYTSTTEASGTWEVKNVVVK